MSAVLILTVISASIIKSTDIIKLASTQDQVVVSMHKELLCFFSPYYSTALNGKFVEAQKDQFEVDLSGEQLQSFVSWIYTGKYTKHEPWAFYIHFYIFADQMDIIALRRDILRWLVRSEDIMPDYSSVGLMLRNVTQHSQLYKWMLDTHIAHWTPSCDANDPCMLNSDEDPDHLLANFIYQIMKGIAVRDEAHNPADLSDCSCCNKICEYHEHESKEEWEASKLTRSV